MNWRLFITIVAVALTWPQVSGAAIVWPTNQPAGYFKIGEKGHQPLVCASWRERTHAEINCKVVGAKLYLPWPTTGAKVAQVWLATQWGKKRVCTQWMRWSQDGVYLGFVARCVDVPPSAPVS